MFKVKIGVNVWMFQNINCSCNIYCCIKICKFSIFLKSYVVTCVQFLLIWSCVCYCVICVFLHVCMFLYPREQIKSIHTDTKLWNSFDIFFLLNAVFFLILTDLAPLDHWSFFIHFCAAQRITHQLKASLSGFNV